jgi:NAD(P)-dependent dehydrogenase (short-subunit alcohol dehydrogenase family)
MYNPFSLQGKTIFVTGASSGIGKAIAIECSKMGARLVITGRNEERLNNTFNQLQGDNHLSIIADLELVENANNLLDNMPELNGIVHCAGYGETLPFPFVTYEKIEKIFKVNFFTPVLLTKNLLQKKLLKKESSVVFISSISGNLCVAPAKSMYSSTKAAVNGIAKNMAIDLAPKKIRVNTVMPGMINTPLIKPGILTEEQLEQDMKKYPLKRYGEPEEVAYAVIYLLSDASKWVTGTNLLIDGGCTLI